MKHLGIDYGTKRTGVAISDTEGRIAFPKLVLSTDKKLLGKIQEICLREKVLAIVLGQSLDYKMQPNPIQSDIEKFKEKLSRFDLSNRGSREAGKIYISVHYQHELLTSAQANTSKAMLDASAAALILQGYLDNKNNTNT